MIEEKILLAPSKGRRRRQSGQTLVEFALVAPLLLVVIFGTIEFCFLYQSANTVGFAAREGARVGAVLGPTDAAADSKIIRCSLSQYACQRSAHAAICAT